MNQLQLVQKRNNAEFSLAMLTIKINIARQEAKQQVGLVL